jgi:ABC-type nitrate/sulfonate/bicarbonate transport system substrate-binding protein
VIAFDGGWNLPIWAAQRQGFFEASGVSVELAYTPTSGFLVGALFDGKADIAFALVDNVVAYQEGQGEAKIPDNPDLFVFMGGDGGFMSLVAANGVGSVKDLKGKTLSVDAMTTGFAFVARELVARSGLTESDVTFVRAGGTATRYRDLVAGKHDATLLRTPFELLAQTRGFRELAGAESLGAYQGTVGIARRGWARDHEAALVGFLKAYKAATDWLYDRGNREIAEALLVANVRDMTPALAKRSYDLLLADKGGLSRDLVADPAGIRTVLDLRSKFGAPQKTLTDPAKYVDLTYYNKAFGKP